MLLITFGSIEAANGIYLKQVVTQAAYEGARVATTIVLQADAAAFVQQVLAARSIQNATVVSAHDQCQYTARHGSDGDRDSPVQQQLIRPLVVLQEPNCTGAGRHDSELTGRTHHAGADSSAHTLRKRAEPRPRRGAIFSAPADNLNTEKRFLLPVYFTAAWCCVP